MIETFGKVNACFAFQEATLSVHRTCSYMLPHMLFNQKFQRMFSPAPVKGCHLNDVNDITVPLLENFALGFSSLSRSVVVHAVQVAVTALLEYEQSLS